MQRILGYIINMLPYMLLVLPIVILARLLTYKIKHKTKVNFYHEIALSLFILFLVGLASQTIIPKTEIDINLGLKTNQKVFSGINIIPFKMFYDMYREVIINKNINYFIINFLGNIVMFIPLGFLISLLWNTKRKNVVLIGFSVSLVIELLQLLLPRGTDIDDIILNTFGAILGVLIYVLLNKKYSRMFEKFKEK